MVFDGWVEAPEGEHLTVFARFKLAPESRNGREQWTSGDGSSAGSFAPGHER